MTGFGPFNFQQSAQQRSQQFHQEASQRAMEMHRQAQQHAQQSAQSMQRLREMQQRQQQQWQNNLKAGYWIDQQRHRQQERQLGAWRNRPSLPAGQRDGKVPVSFQQQPGLTRLVWGPASPARVKEERRGCARVVGGLFLFLFLGLCVSHAVMSLIM